MNDDYMPAPGDVVKIAFSVGVVLDVYRGDGGVVLKILTVANVVKLQAPEFFDLARARQARLAPATADDLQTELASMQRWYEDSQRKGLELLERALQAPITTT